MKYKQYYFTPFLFAILLHLLAFGFVFFAFAETPKPESKVGHVMHQPVRIVNAVTVKQADVDKEVQRLKQQQQQRAAQHKAEQQRLYRQKRAIQRQRQRAAKAQQALQQETTRLRQQQQRLAAQQTQLKKQQAAQQALLKKRQLAQQQKIRQQKLAAVRALATAAEKKQLETVIDRYSALIKGTIFPNFIIPSRKQKKLFAIVLINLASNGTVLGVSVDKSSGSAAFDQAAVTAVYKSSPLPVPKNPKAFAAFRQFKLTMRSDNTVHSG